MQHHHIFIYLNKYEKEYIILHNFIVFFKDCITDLKKIFRDSFKK
ncbi:hypothetical protein HMPREF9089_00265 [Eubacterium brachy ATCC 33089]|nr:hypothetical protein HMPREF9089_00265 [Eubacterium brachy ATCC 33089]